MQAEDGARGSGERLSRRASAVAASSSEPRTASPGPASSPGAGPSAASPGRGSSPGGVSDEAFALLRSSEVVDLHLDTFITVRIFGWDLAKRHGLGLHGGRFFGHVDLPRLASVNLTGAMWSITTNPFRTARGRWRTFERNLARLRALVEGSGGALAIARTLSEYRAARAKGAHACLPAVQGGNCFDAAPDGFRSVPDRLITRVTVVHLTNSALGASSAPVSMLRRDRGLTPRGKALVEALNEARAFVDLAHVHPTGFWDAIDVHDRTQPLIATHTGVSGVTPHWRNLDDRQIKAIAETGGTIGIIWAQQFLHARGRANDGERVLDHMQHVIDVAGEDFVSVGTDLDGAITPPKGLRSVEGYAELVQRMLDRRWSETRIRKVLGGNFLRVFGALRP